MLTAQDESLLHQVSETFDNTPSTDHRFFDRTVVGLHAPDGMLALVTSFGVYKNTNVMDGFAMIQEGAARQFNHRYSPRLRPDVDGMRLGPLSIEILEPLKRLRIRLEKGDYPGSYDIEWTAALPPYEEPKHYTRRDGRVMTDHIRFDQFATATGWIEVEGRRTEFKDWFAWRDHSWGVRPGVGGFEPRTNEADPGAGMLALYSWWLTDEDGGLLQLQETGDGRRLYLDGHIDFRAEPGVRPVRLVDIKHDIKFRPGTRIFDTVRVEATASDGKLWVIEGETIGRPWLYKGSGYDSGYNDEKGLGVYRGPWLEEYDVYDLSDPEACVLPDGRVIRPVHREQIARVRVNGRPGFAHFPLINSGRIPRYGLGM